MTGKHEPQALLADLEDRIAKYKDAPWLVDVSLRLKEAFSKLVAVDPALALDVLSENELVANLCQKQLQSLVVGYGDTPEAVAAFDRIRNLPRRDVRTFIGISTAAAEGSDLREAALDEVLAVADEKNDWPSRAGFCFEVLGNLKGASPKHSQRLAEIATRGFEQFDIRNEETFETAHKLAAQLSQNSVMPDLRDRLSENLRDYERLRRAEKELNQLTAAIENAEKYLDESPKTVEDFLRILEGLKSHSIAVQNEEDGEWYDVPAFDGGRVCVGEGDDMAEFWGGFDEPVSALRDLMEAIGPDEVEIRWSDCSLDLFQGFQEFVEDPYFGRGSFEEYLDRNKLADLHRKGWDGGSPGCSGVWVRVWVEEDRVVPILKELWKAYQFAAAAILPELAERKKTMVS